MLSPHYAPKKSLKTLIQPGKTPAQGYPGTGQHNTMDYLIGGLALFLAVHAIPSTGRLRQAIIARIGPDWHRSLHSFLAVISVGMIYWGYGDTWIIPVYEPPAWGRIPAVGLLFLGCLALGTGLVKTRLGARLRHPMVLAIILWAAGHLFVRGDQSSLILFVTFLAFGLWKWADRARRGEHLVVRDVGPGHQWFLEIGGLVAGAAIFGATVVLHGLVLGVPLVH